MTEDGGAPSHGQAPAAAVAPGGEQHDNEKHLPPPKPMDSRKSTWAVSAFDIHASGMATPLGTHSRRSSGIDLDQYFVSLILLDTTYDVIRLTERDRLDQKI